MGLPSRVLEPACVQGESGQDDRPDGQYRDHELCAVVDRPPQTAGLTPNRLWPQGTRSM